MTDSLADVLGDTNKMLADESVVFGIFDPAGWVSSVSVKPEVLMED